jgi:hypothetical protein
MYQPNTSQVFVGRPPCVNCGAAYRLHAQTIGLQCPEPHRPSTLAEAQQALEEAQRAGDDTRIFAARGDVQRLGGVLPPVDGRPLVEPDFRPKL